MMQAQPALLVGKRGARAGIQEHLQRANSSEVRGQVQWRELLRWIAVRPEGVERCGARCEAHGDASGVLSIDRGQ